MTKNHKDVLLELLGDKLNRYGIKVSELHDRFDLVKSGLLNSLEFVEFLAGMEKRLEQVLDFEHAIEQDDFTTVRGVLRNFE